jgi:hypothetical protein
VAGGLPGNEHLRDLAVSAVQAKTYAESVTKRSQLKAYVVSIDYKQFEDEMSSITDLKTINMILSVGLRGILWDICNVARQRALAIAGVRAYSLSTTPEGEVTSH